MILKNYFTHWPWMRTKFCWNTFPPLLESLELKDEPKRSWYALMLQTRLQNNEKKATHPPHIPPKSLHDWGQGHILCWSIHAPDFGSRGPGITVWHFIKQSFSLSPFVALKWFKYYWKDVNTKLSLSSQTDYFLYPATDSGGVLWFHVGRPCVCQSVRPYFVSGWQLE